MLAGVVVDEHDRPIAGALVDLGSASAGTRTTGDDGWFTFTAVKSGPTIIHVLKEGYIGTMQSVQLQEWRGVVVRMNKIDASLSANKQGILSGLGNSAQQVWVETQTRQVRRAFPAVVITREELALQSSDSCRLAKPFVARRAGRRSRTSCSRPTTPPAC